MQELVDDRYDTDCGRASMWNAKAELAATGPDRLDGAYTDLQSSDVVVVREVLRWPLWSQAQVRSAAVTRADPAAAGDRPPPGGRPRTPCW